jgi:quinoprotein glucose dehydrogenase
LLAALGERSAFAAGPLLDKLLADPDAEVRASALNLAREVRTPQAREALTALVASDSRPPGERSAALSALRAYPGYDPTPVVLDLFPKATDPGFRLELLRALASKDRSAAARLARGLLGEADRPLRQEAISILGSRPDTALELARRFEEGKLPAEDLSRVIDAIRPYATPEIQAVAQALVKKTVLLKPGGDEARRFREFVGRSGNPGRGKAIYIDPKKGGCAVCHRLEGDGGAVGPDLTRVWETLSFEKRIESILEPSKEIKEGFGTYSVATVDGRVLNGLLVSETAEGVTLKDANGREIRVPAKEIDQKATSPTSLMPAGVVGHLSLNEFADLLAFLGDRPAQESLRKPAAAPPTPTGR